MAEIIRMPLMSDTMEEGNIVAWLKEEGDTIEAGDTLAEVETDKATMELDTYVDGVLLHIAVKEGTVPVDAVIAVIGQKGEDWKAALAAADDAKPQNATEIPAESTAPIEEITQDTTAPAEAASDGQRIKASPLARSMAKEAGINISTIKGSGDNGRIVKRDVEQAMGGNVKTIVPVPSTAAPQTQPLTSTFGLSNIVEEGYEDIPLSQMRKIIARRLGESKFSAPHFYLTIEIDMAEAMADRKRINEMIAPSKISFNDLIIKAAAVALKLHPKVNSSWMGDSIRINKAINIGVAVGIDEGLLVPVVRHADMKTLTQINGEVKILAGKAKERKLQPDEMQGNTFTISNLGMFGIEEFTAIINPPDACIMAVGGIIHKPVINKAGEIVPGHRMKVTLSCDHRVVDGVVGSQFLNTFKDLLESPVRLLA